MDGRLAIIGTGRMGGALLHGLLRSGTVTADQVVATVGRAARVAAVAERFEVEVTTDNAAAIAAADVVLLAVKPQVLPGLLADHGAAFRDGQVVVSVAAGVTTATLAASIDAHVEVVRVMTNTPVQVDAAMSVVAGGAGTGEAAIALAEELLAPVGRVTRLAEDKVDVMAAMAGSGPAYLYLVVEALIEVGVELGLTREDATTFAVQTLVGSGALIEATGEHPALLREMVTSPGGSTAAGLRELEAGGLRATIRAGVAAAWQRNRELGGH